MEYPGGGSIGNIAYDASKRITGITTPAGRYTIDRNNAQKLPTQVTTPAGTLAITYYPVTWLVNTVTKTREDETCVYTYTYDDLGNVLTTATEYNDLPLITTTNTYNEDGSRATLVTPAGTFTYSYTDGKLSGIAGPGISGTWTFDSTGRITRINYGSSGAHSIPHYDADAMVGVTNYGPGSTQYSYCATSRDGQGNVIGKSEYFGEDDPYNENTVYTYDAQNQLTNEDFSRQNAPDDYDFTYDTGGNPLYFRSAGPHADADDNNQFTDPGFDYDAAGNPTTYANNDCAYDGDGHLSRFGPTLTPATTRQADACGRK